MTIDIHELAREKFNVPTCDRALNEPGWNGETIALSSYIKAPITVREGYANLDSKIWLIATPGAVGKSALATQLSHDIHAIYLDLAKASTIGGNYISGGLMKNDLYERWTNEDIVLSIDALGRVHTSSMKGVKSMLYWWHENNRRTIFQNSEHFSPSQGECVH